MEEIEVTKKPVRIVRAITKEQSDDEPGEEHEETKSRKVELKRESDGESKKSKVKFYKMTSYGQNDKKRWLLTFLTFRKRKIRRKKKRKRKNQRKSEITPTIAISS